jgi:hypothetical protein
MCLQSRYSFVNELDQLHISFDVVAVNTCPIKCRSIMLLVSSEHTHTHTHLYMLFIDVLSCMKRQGMQTTDERNSWNENKTISIRIHSQLSSEACMTTASIETMWMIFTYALVF